MFRRRSGLACILVIALALFLNICVEAERYDQEDGSWFECTMIDEKKQGFGVRHEADGNILEAYYYNDELQGPSTWYTEDFIWQGMWSDGETKGPVLRCYNDGSFELTNNKENGIQVWVDSDGSVKQTGIFSNGQYEERTLIENKEKRGDITYYGEKEGDYAGGQAIAMYEDGEVYVGGLLNGEREGRGVCYEPDGSWFAGSWKDGLKDGAGVYFGAPENREDGTFTWYRKGVWSEGELQGCIIEYNSSGSRVVYEMDDTGREWGVLISADGTMEVCEWDEDNNYISLEDQVWEDESGNRYVGEKGGYGIEGYGLRMNTDEIYIGDFIDGRKEGNGFQYHIKNGWYQEGEYVNGRYNGMGMTCYANGDVYCGMYAGNYYNGEGILYYTDGSVEEGTFKEGRLATGKRICALDNGSWDVAFYEDGKKQEGTAGVTVYHDAGYYGNYAVFEPGEYNLSDLVARGISDNSISSIRIPEGYCVKVYHHDGLQGIFHKYMQNVDFTAEGLNEQTRWNDSVSSFAVEKME